MRDYETMRNVLSVIAKANRPAIFNDFMNLQQRDKVVEELIRLQHEGLIESTLAFDNSGCCVNGEVSGLTDAGTEFYRLIENDDVWAIICGVLKKANLNLLHPFLKEVCEEVVKRYVASFIPEIKPLS